MILAIDIGNSNICMAIWYKDKWTRMHRISNKTEYSVQEYALSILGVLSETEVDIFDNAHEITTTVISSVVPRITKAVEQAVAPLTQEILFIDSTLNHPITGDIPPELGQDLFANAMCSHVKSNPHILHAPEKSIIKTTSKIPLKSSITVDLGTALTFIGVHSDGSIAGVSIAPGIKTSLTALYEGTALLEKKPLSKPKSILGTTTVEAINSGMIWGYKYLLQGVINQIESKLAPPVRIYATGGLINVLSGLIAPFMTATFDEISLYHTLDGLKLFVEYNSKFKKIK